MEIFQNTIIKLVFRQGADSDRQTIVLESGEPGFTTDTKRLFVGDGVTSGGVVVGNLYRGKSADLTALSPGVPGDFGYSTDLGNLYAIRSGDGSVLSDWELIGGGYYDGSRFITVSSNNVISLNLLSANSVSEDLLSLSGAIVLNADKRLAVQVDSPLVIESNTIKLGALSSNSVDTDLINPDCPIVLDGFGRLNFQQEAPLYVENNTLKLLLSSIVNLIYPVGSVYYCVSSTDPNTLFVGTTWQRIAEGQFLVGVGTGTDSDLNTQTFLSGVNTGLFIDKNLVPHEHYLANPGEGPAGQDGLLSANNFLAYEGGGFFGADYHLDGNQMYPTIGLTSEPLSTNYNTALSVLEPATYTSLSSIPNYPPSFGLYVWHRTS